MRSHKLIALTAIPLLWASVAFAQSAPAESSGSTGWQSRHQEDPIAAHKQACSNHYAHAAGKLAFLEAKLALTDKQHQAWTKWQQWKMDTAAKERSACLDEAPKAEASPTVLDREEHLEKELSMRLDGLRASRPALQALYDVLTPEQKAIFDHMHGRQGHHFGGRHQWR